MSKAQPWIGNKWIDIPFVLLPPFFSLAVVFLFPSLFHNDTGMPDYWWVILVLLIDVAHVYSTLYRTYFDRITFQQYKNLLVLVPFVSFVTGVLMYTFSAVLFWSLLAYLAVFHFVRQQYGFMRIYARKESTSSLNKRIDSITIYAATLYPLLFWHLSGDRTFHWFVEGDFLTSSRPVAILPYIGVVYLGILMIYLVKEVTLIIKTSTINIPRNAVVVGTVASWYIGIVYLNGDMAFTLLNVVSHGVPYMALIWIYGNQRKRNAATSGKLVKLVFGRYGIVLFLGLIFLLAYLEEGLWDLALWNEHQGLFRAFHFIDTKPGKTLLSLLVPLLAVPQVTHYIVDGFIWSVNKVAPVLSEPGEVSNHVPVDEDSVAR